MNIISRYIKQFNEHARSKATAERRLDSLADEFAYHIMKLMLYKSADEGTKHHWVKEISAMLKKAFRIRRKGSNRKLSEKTYKEFLFDPNLESIQDIRDTIGDVLFDNEHYHVPHEILNEKEVYLKVIEFEKEILPLLAGKELVPDQVFQDIVRKHFIG